jgi:hypothetical protein
MTGFDTLPPTFTLLPLKWFYQLKETCSGPRYDDPRINDKVTACDLLDSLIVFRENCRSPPMVLSSSLQRFFYSSCSIHLTHVPF